MASFRNIQNELLPKGFPVVHLFVEKWGERIERCQFERILAGDEIAGKNSPRALIAPDIVLFCKNVYHFSQIGAVADNGIGQRLRNFNTPRAPE